MEKTLLDDQSLYNLVISQVNYLWAKFPNLWNVCEKDDIVSDAFYDLYTVPRGHSKTRLQECLDTYGKKNVSYLIYMLVYANLQHIARMFYKGDQYNLNITKVMFNKAVSLSSPVEEGTDLTMLDTIPSKYNLEMEVDYKILYENLPDKYYENYEVRDGCVRNVISYHLIIDYLLNGYTVSQISEKVYKKGSDSPVHCQIVYNMVNSLRKDVQGYLESIGRSVEGYKHAIDK